MKVKDLRLGDVVRLFEGAYGTATVKQTKDGVVTLFRPYGHTSDFSYTGGVICYVGMESIVYHDTSEQDFHLYSRGEVS